MSRSIFKTGLSGLKSRHTPGCKQSNRRRRCRAKHQRPIAHAGIGGHGSCCKARNGGDDIVDRELTELQMAVHQAERHGCQTSEEERQAGADRDPDHARITIIGSDDWGERDDDGGAGEAGKCTHPEDLVELPLTDLLALNDRLLKSEILEKRNEGHDRTDRGDKSEIFRNEQARQDDDGEELDNDFDALCDDRQKAAAEGNASKLKRFGTHALNFTSARRVII